MTRSEGTGQLRPPGPSPQEASFAAIVQGSPYAHFTGQPAQLVMQQPQDGKLALGPGHRGVLSCHLPYLGTELGAGRTCRRLPTQAWQEARGKHHASRYGLSREGYKARALPAGAGFALPFVPSPGRAPDAQHSYPRLPGCTGVVSKSSMMPQEGDVMP